MGPRWEWMYVMIFFYLKRLLIRLCCFIKLCSILFASKKSKKKRVLTGKILTCCKFKPQRPTKRKVIRLVQSQIDK